MLVKILLLVFLAVIAAASSVCTVCKEKAFGKGLHFNSGCLRGRAVCGWNLFLCRQRSC